MIKSGLKNRLNHPRREFDLSQSQADCSSLPVRYALKENMSALESLALGDGYVLFLAQTLNIISLSPVGRAMVREAGENGWHVALDQLDGNDFYIDAERQLIVLDHHGLKAEGLMRSAYFANTILINTVKALRDIWQEKRYGSFHHLFSAESILMMERIRAADCDVLAIMTAWELRSEGHTDIWRHVIGSAIGDMALIYSMTLERDPAAQFNGKALRATFKGWYELPERVNACDHLTLEYLDDILEHSEVKNPFGRKMPTHIAVELMSCLPDKTAYLQGFGREVLIDPLYSGLDDETNQSHLMHILYDLEVTLVHNVPFRNSDLAARIFPEDMILEDITDIDPEMMENF